MGAATVDSEAMRNVFLFRTVLRERSDERQCVVEGQCIEAITASR